MTLNSERDAKSQPGSSERKFKRHEKYRAWTISFALDNAHFLWEQRNGVRDLFRGGWRVCMLVKLERGLGRDIDDRHPRIVADGTQARM
jgi:hypothetical protein